MDASPEPGGCVGPAVEWLKVRLKVKLCLVRSSDYRSWRRAGALSASSLVLSFSRKLRPREGRRGSTGLEGRVRPRAQGSWLSTQDLFYHIRGPTCCFIGSAGVGTKIEIPNERSLNSNLEKVGLWDSSRPSSWPAGFPNKIALPCPTKDSGNKIEIPGPLPRRVK